MLSVVQGSAATFRMKSRAFRREAGNSSRECSAASRPYGAAVTENSLRTSFTGSSFMVLFCIDSRNTFTSSRISRSRASPRSTQNASRARTPRGADGPLVVESEAGRESDGIVASRLPVSSSALRPLGLALRSGDRAVGKPTSFRTGTLVRPPMPLEKPCGVATERRSNEAVSLFTRFKFRPLGGVSSSSFNSGLTGASSPNF
mmetsp:Transcript_33898/g.59788  ORF Transcript_33898/g.59788 Transcript_33898/m.59788 type:complete len:203 (-) Transcript_33898:663-1271(-)